MKKCLACGAWGNIEAHHLRLPGDGIGQKPGDERCLPLGGEGGCGCHGLFHRQGLLAINRPIEWLIDTAVDFKKEWDQYIF